ncbi:MAG: phosphotransferase [Halopseudomonas sp.]
MSDNVQQLDLDKLGTYLEANGSEIKGIKSAKKFAGGQSNPTFLLEAETGRYVLRRQPPGKLLKSAHAVDREYRVIRALADSDVPVPKTYLLCEDPDVVGSMFYMMDFVDGQIYWDPKLPELDNAQRSHVYSQMNQVLASIHNVDLEAAGLSDYGRPGNYFARQVSLWTKQYRASETEHIEEMEQLISWIEANVPEDDGRVALVHGDYRLDNIMFSKSDLQAITVLDWELSTLGHPFADIAYQCTMLRLSQDSPIPGLQGIDRQSLGIPTEEEYVADYCKRTGISGIDNWHFYLAFSLLRAAGIAQGVQKRALGGNASSKMALAVGAMVRPAAVMALDIIEQG